MFLRQRLQLFSWNGRNLGLHEIVICDALSVKQQNRQQYMLLYFKETQYDAKASYIVYIFWGENVLYKMYPSFKNNKLSFSEINKSACV
jgi:hypothetical protein